MKIYLFHPWIKSKGGAERLIYEYYKRSKNKIIIFTWYYNRKKSFEIKNIISLFNRFDFLFRQFLLRGMISLLIMFIKIPQNSDLYLLSTSGIAELSLIRLKKKSPIVLYCHTPLRAAYYDDILWNYRYRFTDPLMKFIYKVALHLYNHLERKAWKKVDFVIFNSELSRKRALDKKLIDVNKTKVIYPGADLEGFYNDKPENYFLYVARIGLAKRQELLIKAFAKFSKEYPEYKLVLVGGLENRKYYLRLLKLINELNLRDKVIIKTDVSDRELKELYAKCLAFIHIPFMEDFGIVPLEAMASGKYVINVYPSGNYEILKNASGIYWIKERFDNEKMIEEIYNAMKYFIENKEELIKNGLKNREYIKKLDLSWERFTKELDETLDSLNLEFK